MKISVIIPALNEARSIAGTLESLARAVPAPEIIVVDGGSADATRRIVASHPQARLIDAQPPRAAQMNAGARAAKGDIVLFLHADTRLPSSWQRDVLTVMSRHPDTLGAFRLRIGHAALPFRLIEAGANVRSRLLGLPYGDQAFFIRKEFFEKLGAFPEIALMEDVSLARSASRSGRVRLTRSHVTTSPRRWLADGVWSRTFRNACLLARFLAGIETASFATRYGRSRAAVAIFCRLPVPGQVKTRLAHAIGNEEAAVIYRRLAEKTIVAVSGTHADVEILVYCSPPGSETKMEAWLGTGPTYRPQEGTDLGDKMANAMLGSLDAGHSSCVIVGTDCPGLESHHIDAAIRFLRKYDVVIGPARDGGYYLIAASTPHPELFAGIPWSSPDVLAATLKAVERLGLKARLLDTLSDVDNGADLEDCRRDGLL